jgi:hypothetical protein
MMRFALVHMLLGTTLVEPPPPEPREGNIGFEWDAPEQCPDEEQVYAMVSERMPASLHESGARLDVIARVRETPDKKWSLRVWFITDDGTKTRDLVDEDCQLLADAVAILVAARLQPASDAAAVDEQVQPSPPELQRNDSAAEQTYETQRIFVDSHLFGLTFVPHLGDGTSLKEPTFYNKIERPDLAQKYTRRRRAKIGLLVVGPVMMAGGLATALGVSLRPTRSGSTIDEFEAASREESRNLAIGLGVGVPLAVLGMGATLTGALLRRDPINVAEAQALARSYNLALKKRLGLPEHFEVNVSGDRSRFGFSISGAF